MLRLDILGILISLFLLGPRNWRWSLAAAAVTMVATCAALLVWRVELVAYTMGGIFTQVDLTGGRLGALLLGYSGPFACYAVARLSCHRPMGEIGWLRQLLPWSKLENPMAGTFAKFALLTAIFITIQAITG